MVLRRAKKYFYLVFIVIVILGGIKLLSWAPGMIQQDTIREYESLADVHESLGIEDIFTPSYFPQNIQWPPSEIIAQKKPFVAVITAYAEKDTGKRLLVIQQSRTNTFVPDEGIGMSDIKEVADHDVNGKLAKIEAGSCTDGSACSSITWKEGGYHIRIVMKSHPLELLKIAESLKRH